MLAAATSELVPLGLRLPLWSALPFALTLAALAIMPLVAKDFWHRHYPKVIAALALAFAIPFMATFHGEAWHELSHIVAADYFPFIVMIIGLYVTTGGMILRGRLAGTPAVNTAVLAVGTALASVIGTTGASMLLIRPLLRANAHRKERAHLVVFFIFLVANIGGCLTPLGDPPLFLGFLAGVPFGWTLRLAPELVLLAGVLLPLFYLIDRAALRRESIPPPLAGTSGGIRLEGKRNLIFVALIVGAVLLSGIWHPGIVDFAGIPFKIEWLVRDVIILACAAASLWWTPAVHRSDNDFSWGPMREVAIVFAGIFVTILPLLAILKAGAAGALGPVFTLLDTPRNYFWSTGLLSSVLDNAPTYLTMLNQQVQRFGTDGAFALARDHAEYLSAVSSAAVFMGANSYIGNAPNFMVKAIAEDAGVAMPSFFGYVVRYTIPILMPLFLLLGVIFY